MPTTSTTTFYTDCVPTLIKNCYSPVPIVPGEKRPAIKDWLNFVHTDAALVRYKNNGVGLLCGQGEYPLVGVDIDVMDERLAQTLHDAITLTYGETIYRIGKAPKRLLLYRASEPGITKMAVKQGSEEPFAILSDGQQFVAYGTHPDTHTAYDWPGILGGPMEMEAINLPVLNIADLRDLVEMAGKLLGGEHTKALAPGADDIFDNSSAPIEDKTIPELLELLGYLDPDNRDTWLRGGMALHHQAEDDPDALAGWTAWSSKSKKFRPGECAKMWGGFKGGSGRPVTARWLISFANKIKSAREKGAVDTEYRILLADIEACVDHQTLLEDIAPRVVGMRFDGARVAVLEKFLADKASKLLGAKLPKGVIQDAIYPKAKRTTEMTEIGNSSRMINRYGSNLLYCPETDQWFRWDGTRYHPCVKEIVLRYAHTVVEELAAEASTCSNEKQSDEIYNWYIQSRRSAMLDNMVKLCQKDPSIMVSPNDLDADVDYIGVLNGAVHLPTGKLTQPDKSQRLTLNTGYAYDPGAQCPIFEQTVLDVFFGDRDMADFLQQLIGYTLCGHPEREEIIVIPEGKGANGKSTVFNAIHHTLGSYGRFASADTFVNARSGASASGAREDVLRLIGSRFVYVTELEENGVLKESFVKGMTGGESIPARGLYARHTVEVTPTWVAWMPTNHLPVVKGEDKGIWRKLVVIPFHRDFTNDVIIEKDEKRKSLVKAEAPGILRWCIEGATAYHKNGLHIPEKIRKASESYRTEMDLLGGWLDECCDQSVNFSASNKDLWCSWEPYAKREGNFQFVSSSAALARRLMGRGFKRIRNTMGVKGRGFSGLSVKPDSISL